MGSTQPGTSTNSYGKPQCSVERSTIPDHFPQLYVNLPEGTSNHYQRVWDMNGISMGYEWDVKWDTMGYMMGYIHMYVYIYIYIMGLVRGLEDG